MKLVIESRIGLVAWTVLTIMMPWNPALAAKPSQLDLSKGESRVEFVAIGKPSAIKIKGTGGPMQGLVKVADSGVTGTLNFDLNSLDTGIALRNEHMKVKYLQTSQNPTAQLTLTRVALPLGWSEKKERVEGADFEGKLKLHGVEKPVVGKISVLPEGTMMGGSAEFKIKISDFGIDVPSYAGITVTDEVQIQTSFKAPMEQTN